MGLPVIWAQARYCCDKLLLGFPRTLNSRWDARLLGAWLAEGTALLIDTLCNVADWLNFRDATLLRRDCKRISENFPLVEPLRHPTAIPIDDHETHDRKSA